MATQRISALDARAQGDWLSQLAADKAENDYARFRAVAELRIVDYLIAKGEASGEVLVDHCEDSGIVVQNARSYGAVFKALRKRGVIIPTGRFAVRRKGHLSGASPIWAVSPDYKPGAQ